MTSANSPISFIDNRSVSGQEDKYKTVTVDVDKIIQNWRSSLFAHSWFHADGRMKALEELSDIEQERRRDVEQQIDGKQHIERPVLGIGLLDNVEIGSGRSVFVTLAAHQYKEVSVHIRLSNEDELKDFIIS